MIEKMAISDPTETLYGHVCLGSTLYLLPMSSINLIDLFQNIAHDRFQYGMNIRDRVC